MTKLALAIVAHLVASNTLVCLPCRLIR